MADRDELADLIYRTLNPEIQQPGWLPTIDGTGNVVSHITADAILARWRLVPMEEVPIHGEDCPLCRHPWDHHNRMGCQDCKVCITPRYGPDDHIAAQHRAAGELTRHDQTAGHYDDVRPPVFKLRHSDGCECGRTDNHGPHED